MNIVNPLSVSGAEVWPLIEGGKGIGVSNGKSAGAWAAAGGVGTFSAVNADSYDKNGNPIPQIYHARTRRDRHEELLRYAIEGGVTQARIAHEIASGNGRLHMNVLWEMGGSERVLHGILERTRGLVHGVTCGAGMPYKIAEIASRYNIHYYPIVSSGRAFNALWRRAYHRVTEWLGGVVYEDPWRAGGHNGLSNSEDPSIPEDPYPRVIELRRLMNKYGLNSTPIIMAGGVWCLDDWSDWINNSEIGPVAFQFGTRPLITKESPIPEVWKQKLRTLKEGDIRLNKFSPTGFYSSAVRNRFIEELQEREQRQVAFTSEPIGDHSEKCNYGMRGRTYYLTRGDKVRVEQWVLEGFDTALKTPDSTLIFVNKEKAKEIRLDQANCMGCLSQCRFSNWATNERATTGKKADPRSYCIQKTLQEIIHGDDVEGQLMFSGHGAFRFSDDPFYANGFIPTVKELVDRLLLGK